MTMTKIKGDKKVNDSALEKSKEFDFKFNELNMVAFHCNVLQDFLYAPFQALRKIHTNYQACKTFLEKIGDEAVALNKRQGDLNKKLSESQNKSQEEGVVWEEPEDLKKVRIDHNLAIEEFNMRDHKIKLFTVAESDFPQDRTKYEKKTVEMGPTQSREVDTFTSFLGLLGTVIVE